MSLSDLIFIIEVPCQKLILSSHSFSDSLTIGSRLLNQREGRYRGPKREREGERPNRGDRMWTIEDIRKRLAVGTPCIEAGANKLQSRVKGPREGTSLLELLSPARSDRYLLSRLVVVERMTKTRAALCQEPRLLWEQARVFVLANVLVRGGNCSCRDRARRFPPPLIKQCSVPCRLLGGCSLVPVNAYREPITGGARESIDYASIVKLSLALSEVGGRSSSRRYLSSRAHSVISAIRIIFRAPR